MFFNRIVSLPLNLLVSVSSLSGNRDLSVAQHLLADQIATAELLRDMVGRRGASGSHFHRYVKLGVEGLAKGCDGMHTLGGKGVKHPTAHKFEASQPGGQIGARSAGRRRNWRFNRQLEQLAEQRIGGSVGRLLGQHMLTRAQRLIKAIEGREHAAHHSEAGLGEGEALALTGGAKLGLAAFIGAAQGSQGGGKLLKLGVGEGVGLELLAASLADLLLKRGERDL